MRRDEGAVSPRGILRPGEGRKHFEHARRRPGAALAPYVEHYWMVSWDLRERGPYRSETLPHPNIHMVLEPRCSRVVGVMRGKFSRTLEGKGRVLGIKFKPGGFYPFLSAASLDCSEVAELQDRSVPLREVFPEHAEAFEEASHREQIGEDEASRVTAIEGVLTGMLAGTKGTWSEMGAQLERLGEIMERAALDPEILDADRLARAFGLNRRSLQRLFRRYVGVGPKWVIQRYRLHEAAERIAAGSIDSWASLASECGYYDQAHFIRDFQAVVGTTPARYAESCRVGEDDEKT